MNRKVVEKHGHCPKSGPSPTYKSWRAMHRRCKDPKDKNYKYYGGIGVRVCKRWESLAVFVSDMGEKPKGTSLSRKGDKGNYTPKNCLWQTPSEQGQQRTKKKTHCKRGHSLVDCYFRKGRRYCKVCRRESERNRKKK